jgi:hypothetical protein
VTGRVRTWRRPRRHSGSPLVVDQKFRCGPICRIPIPQRDEARNPRFPPPCTPDICSLSLSGFARWVHCVLLGSLFTTLAVQPSRCRRCIGIQRWTRTGPSTLEYQVTIEDPTVWVQPWTVKEEFTRQSDRDNKLFTEPRCIEGNYGLPGIIHGRRMEERAFAEGRGPDPATRDAMKDGFIFDDEPLR